MIGRTLLAAVFFLSCVVPVASAQDKFEITPFAGSRFGGSIDLSTSTVGTPVVDYLNIKSSVSYGAIFDYTLWDNFQPEFMWNRQPTELSAHYPANNSIADVSGTDLDMFQFGFLYSFRRPRAKLKPFIAGGLGFTHFEYLSSTAAANGLVPDFNNRFSYNLGVGVKYFFNKYVGLRLEGRWSPSRTTSSPQEYCDEFDNCYLANAANHAEQGQANVGLIIRFK
jgi:opacity protein-like surface antigen